MVHADSEPADSAPGAGGGCATPRAGPLLPASAHPRRLRPAIDSARCTGCGRCVAVCPPHVLCLERRGWDKTALLHDGAGCTGCALCAARCPFGAITMVPPALLSPPAP